ncbi:MAG: hypothetical protein HOP21_03985 [Methylotenera sp.]|nr:hypothetical protein [Methylotenera sp.]
MKILEVEHKGYSPAIILDGLVGGCLACPLLRFKLRALCFKRVLIKIIGVTRKMKKNNIDFDYPTTETRLAFAEDLAKREASLSDEEKQIISSKMLADLFSTTENQK